MSGVSVSLILTPLDLGYCMIVQLTMKELVPFATNLRSVNLGNQWLKPLVLHLAWETFSAKKCQQIRLEHVRVRDGDLLRHHRHLQRVGWLSLQKIRPSQGRRGRSCLRLWDQMLLRMLMKLDWLLKCLMNFGCYLRYTQSEKWLLNLKIRRCWPSLTRKWVSTLW